MRYSTVWCVVVFGFFVCTSAVCPAKSVYLIGDTSTGRIQVYEIGDDELVLMYDADLTIGSGGAIDLAIDESPAGTYLFVTYEFNSFIRVLDARNMQVLKDVTLPHAADLSGIVYDTHRSKIYTVDRKTDHLYSYSWDARDLSLEPDFEPPYYVQLENISQLEDKGAFGITLDDVNDYLYVSDATGEIKCYHASDWSYAWSVQTSINEVLGVEVDPQSQVLYFGSMDDYGQPWKYLSQYDLSVFPLFGPESRVEVGASICGIACDPETGYVYATSFSDGTNGNEDSVLMFCPYDPNNPADPNLTLVWDSPQLGSPAGIVMSKTGYKPSGGISVMVTDDVDDMSCVEPGAFITYSIVARSLRGEQTNVTVTDALPPGVDFVSADPNTGIYMPQPDHVYVWDIGTLPDPNGPGDPNSYNTYLTITVQVNSNVEPLGELMNRVTAESDTAYDVGEETTDVCCFGGNVIYVDRFATGSGSGTSWANAYSKLEDALSRAEKDCGDEIWVAQGLYSPGTTYSDTFEVTAGISVYGGFCGTETSVTERDLLRYKTILSGQDINQVVVTMGWGAALDGLTIENANRHAISGTNVPFSVTNCIIRSNGLDGINCQDGRVTIAWSELRDNGEYGVYVYSEQPWANRELRIFNSRIHGNQFDGIRAVSSTIEIRDSLIYGNGLAGDYFGLRLVQPVTGGIVHSNTIADNKNEGIRFVGENLPDVRNCILWGNDGGQLSGLDEDSVYWCCIQDCNDINQGNNINDDPLFAYSQEPYGFYHLLSANSPCVDAGDATYVDPNSTGEWDIDGDERIINGYVDIGADEFSCEAVTHSIDWTFDGIIDAAELAIFAEAWLSSDPNEPGITTDPNYIGQPQYRDPAWFVNWDGRCDLNADYWIDFGDWAYFAYYWKWRACWRDSGYDVWAMGEGGLLQGGQLEMIAMSHPLFEAYEAEPTVEEEYAQAQEIVTWLENLWENDAEAREVIDKKEWKEFMDHIYTWVANIEQELY